MEKILGILITSMFLMTGFSAIASVAQTEIIANTNFEFNFAIEKVTFEPNPPKKNELVIFNVTVAFENWERGAVKVQGWIDGATNGGMEGYVDPAFGLYSAEIPVYWPDDAEEHTVKMMVDPDGIWDETNENDNIWEDSIKAKPRIRFVNNFIMKILEQFPLLQHLFKLIN